MRFWWGAICFLGNLSVVRGTVVGLCCELVDGFGFDGLEEGVWFLVDFFAVEGDVVVEVVIDLYASHAADNNF